VMEQVRTSGWEDQEMEVCFVVHPKG
jgi:hypothetical protein